MNASAVALFAWVPMLFLAVAERLVRGSGHAIELFASDITSHVRFLVAVPLLIFADAMIRRAFTRCESYIERPGFVGARDTERLRVGLERERRLRMSPLASVIIGALVFAVAIGTRGRDIGSWAYFDASEPAGSWPRLWLGLVAFPMFRFLLLRGFYRWLVWAGFLFWLRRLDLCLVATHPDRCGGLGFLTVPISAALAVVFGVSVTAAFAWRHAVVSHGATLAQVQGQALLFAAVWIVLYLGPLVFFAPQLLRLKRIAMVDYSRLGNDYTRAFQEKWLRRRPDDEELLGSPDIQSLADLAASMNVVQTLRPTPIDLHVFLSVLFVYAVALLPLILSQLSLNELLTRLLQVVV